MAKALEAFRNIGEVSVELGIKKHVLRFWEMKFPQLKPMKRGGGRRLYRPTDVELLRGIRDLLRLWAHIVNRTMTGHFARKRSSAHPFGIRFRPA